MQLLFYEELIKGGAMKIPNVYLEFAFPQAVVL